MGCYARRMQVIDSRQLVRRGSRHELLGASALTVALSLVTIVSGRPAGWEPIFPFIFAVVLFAPVLAAPNRAGNAGLVLVGLVAGTGGLGSFFAMAIRGLFVDAPSSEAGRRAMLGLLAVYTVAGLLFVGRAAISFLRNRPTTSVWFYLATSTACILAVQIAWIVRSW